MTDKEIEEELGQRFCLRKEIPNSNTVNYICKDMFAGHTLDYINRLKSEKKLAETQLKDLLSALYRTSGGEKGFTLYRKDIVELAEDYGIKEEELK